MSEASIAYLSIIPLSKGYTVEIVTKGSDLVDRRMACSNLDDLFTDIVKVLEPERREGTEDMLRRLAKESGAAHP
jgi:hypothetical protein